MEVAGFSVGLREAVIALIVLVGLYMVFVVLRMRHLHGGAAQAEATPEVEGAGLTLPLSTTDEEDEPLFAPRQRVEPAAVPRDTSERMASQLLVQGLERELAQLRDEVDALRAELAGLRGELHKEMTVLRAAQTVSPIYGDAMQLALSGYGPERIAERCGIARAEAELVAALARSREEDHR